jgi:uncharacterized protein
VLIAHSAGCLATVAWAGRYAGPVLGALLVTPPHLDGIGPREKLPFRATLVASRTDPYTSFAQFEQFAADWGAELVDAGDAGHLETASGYGPWPAGERLVAALS